MSRGIIEDSFRKAQVEGLNVVVSYKRIYNRLYLKENL